MKDVVLLIATGLIIGIIITAVNILFGGENVYFLVFGLIFIIVVFENIKTKRENKKLKDQLNIK